MNPPSFLPRVLLSLLLFLPLFSFGEHVDGAFAGHTDAEQRIWLRSQMWVSGSGSIQLALGQSTLYLGQQLYVPGSPTGLVEQAEEVPVEFRRIAADGTRTAWKPMSKTNKWTGAWAPKIKGDYEFRVGAQPEFGAPNNGGIQYQLLDAIPESAFGPSIPLL